MLRISIFGSLARSSDGVPARIDLQVRGNNVAEFARDGRRKRRFDCCSPGRWPRHRLALIRRAAALIDRGYRSRNFGRRLKLIRKRWSLREKRSQFLTNFNGVADFRFPLAHYSREGGLDR